MACAVIGLREAYCAAVSGVDVSDSRDTEAKLKRNCNANGLFRLIGPRVIPGFCQFATSWFDAPLPTASPSRFDARHVARPTRHSRTSDAVT